jgi:hypothetical protein
MADEDHLAVGRSADAPAASGDGAHLELDDPAVPFGRHPSKRTVAIFVKISLSGCRFGAGPIVVRATTNPNSEMRRIPMRYVLLIAGDENASPSEDVTPEYVEWMKMVTDRGLLQGGERLRPTSDATTVRVRNGEVLSTDGPFAETKEQLGGYFIVDCKDLDEAIEVAGKIPGAKAGSIEVRPIWEM